MIGGELDMAGVNEMEGVWIVENESLKSLMVMDVKLEA